MPKTNIDNEMTLDSAFKDIDNDLEGLNKKAYLEYNMGKYEGKYKKRLKKQSQEIQDKYKNLKLRNALTKLKNEENSPNWLWDYESVLNKHTKIINNKKNKKISLSKRKHSPFSFYRLVYSLFNIKKASFFKKLLAGLIWFVLIFNHPFIITALVLISLFYKKKKGEILPDKITYEFNSNFIKNIFLSILAYNEWIGGYFVKKLEVVAFTGMTLTGLLSFLSNIKVLEVASGTFNKIFLFLFVAFVFKKVYQYIKINNF